MANNKLCWEKEKKREEKEEKKKKKEKKEEKGEGKQTENKEQGRYPLILYTVNPSTSPGTFQCCLVKNLFFPWPGLLGEGPAVLILRCEHFGELLSPLLGAGLRGSCLSCLSCEATVKPSGCCLSFEAPGGTTIVAAASSGALDSAPALTMESQSARAWMLQGGADLQSSGPPGGRSILAVLGPPASACPVGSTDPGLCPPVPWAPGPALLQSLPGRASPPAAPSSLSCLWAAPGPAGQALQPFRELGHGCGHSPRGRCLLVPPGAWGHPCPPGILPELPASTFLSGKVGAAPAPPGLGSPTLGALATGP